MPRPRARNLFELCGQWIAEEPGRPGLYRFWNDPGNGRTRRASLGTADIETAKKRLAEVIVIGATKTNDSHIAVVLENYFIDKTDHLTSKHSARNAGRLMLECWGALTKVRSLTDELQKKFVAWSFERNHAVSTVSRNLGVLAAAVAHAKLSVAVIYNEGAILARWPEFDPKPARKSFEPSDAELARLLAANMPESLRRWIMNSMATGGRPEAVLNICPASRARDLGLIDLNPEGRRQNKKYRPTVRELPLQSRWLDEWEKEALKAAKGGEERLPQYCSYASVDSIDTALRRLCAKPEVSLPLMSVYSFRHRVASVLRASKAPRVPGEQISYQLGHRRPGDRTTRGYGAYEPDYLDEAARALNAWIGRVLELAKANSHAIPTTAPKRRVAGS